MPQQPINPQTARLAAAGCALLSAVGLVMLVLRGSLIGIVPLAMAAVLLVVSIWMGRRNLQRGEDPPH